jgi:hypothetical protein
VEGYEALGCAVKKKAAQLGQLLACLSEAGFFISAIRAASSIE